MLWKLDMLVCLSMMMYFFEGEFSGSKHELFWVN